MLLFGFLPTWLANGLHRYLQYFVAMFFTARVAEEQLGLDRKWSAFAASLHACFAYFTVGALFTIPGVPMLAWILDRLGRQWRSIAIALLAGITFSFLTTFTFGVPYLLVFTAGWTFVVRRAWTWHAARQFAALWIALGLMEAPQLLAVIVNAPGSHRAGWPAQPIAMSVDGLFYRQLQFDMFAQDRVLSAITLNLPASIFLVSLPIAVIARRRANLRGPSNAFSPFLRSTVFCRKNGCGCYYSKRSA
jgi:hypothetical protein